MEWWSPASAVLWVGIGTWYLLCNLGALVITNSSHGHIISGCQAIEIGNL